MLKEQNVQLVNQLVRILINLQNKCIKVEDCEKPNGQALPLSLLDEQMMKPTVNVTKAPLIAVNATIMPTEHAVTSKKPLPSNPGKPTVHRSLKMEAKPEHLTTVNHFSTVSKPPLAQNPILKIVKDHNSPSSVKITKLSCPIGGTWSSWKQITNCTDSCGACGTVTLSRTCLTESQGCPCIGEPTKKTFCNITPCRYPRKSCCQPFKARAYHKKIVCGPLPGDDDYGKTG
uniref:Uncharacterized protein n=1 Tax=Panagrolaimus sp. JU765 TaxID=591449 RepID=A0AC34QBB5_9BILA